MPSGVTRNLSRNRALNVDCPLTRVTTHPPPRRPQREPRARVGDVYHVDVIGHVQVKVAVAVHVTQRQAHGCVFPRQTVVGRLGEPAPAVVQEQSRAGGDAVDQQVGVAVAVDIGEHRAGGELPGTTDPGRIGDVGELPAAEIPVQPICSLQIGEVEVAQAVAIHVGGGDSGPIVSHGIGEEHFAEQPIGETQAGQRRRQEFKTGVARSRNAKRSAPVAWAIIPSQVGCRDAKRIQRQADETGQTQCHKGALGQAWFRKRHRAPSSPKPGPRPTQKRRLTKQMEGPQP